MTMNVWAILGIDPTKDTAAIKRAYAQRAKAVHPEEHPEEFQQLQQAYQLALRQAKGGWVWLSGEHEPEAEPEALWHSEQEALAEAQTTMERFEFDELMATDAGQRAEAKDQQARAGAAPASSPTVDVNKKPRGWKRLFSALLRIGLWAVACFALQIAVILLPIPNDQQILLVVALFIGWIVLLVRIIKKTFGEKRKDYDYPYSASRIIMAGTLIPAIIISINTITTYLPPEEPAQPVPERPAISETYERESYTDDFFAQTQVWLDANEMEYEDLSREQQAVILETMAQLDGLMSSKSAQKEIRQAIKKLGELQMHNSG